MATLAIDAYGSLFKQGDGGSPEAFTTVAECTTIGGPSLEADAIDVTSHTSAAAFREFVGGLKDGGEVSLNINYVPTGGTHDATTGLLKDYNDRTVRNWQLVFPDAGSTTWSFAGLVTAFNPDMPVDDRLSAEVTIKLTGQPTLA